MTDIQNKIRRYDWLLWGKTKFLLKCDFGYLEHTKKSNGVRDVKIPLTVTILSISQVQIKVK